MVHDEMIILVSIFCLTLPLFMLVTLNYFWNAWKEIDRQDKLISRVSIVSIIIQIPYALPLIFWVILFIFPGIYLDDTYDPYAETRIWSAGDLIGFVLLGFYPYILIASFF